LKRIVFHSSGVNAGATEKSIKLGHYPALPVLPTTAVFVLRLSGVNLLSVKNLSVRIQDKLIIEELTFDLAARERLSILGPNGAGKTVLLKALLNLISYTGQIVWSPEVRLGYVPLKIDADIHLPLTFTDLF